MNNVTKFNKVYWNRHYVNNCVNVLIPVLLKYYYIVEWIGLIKFVGWKRAKEGNFKRCLIIKIKYSNYSLGYSYSVLEWHILFILNE